MPRLAATLILSLGVLAAGTMASSAKSPEDYRYCAIESSGATVCYFDSHAQCDAAGSGRCIENPSYNDHRGTRHGTDY